MVDATDVDKPVTTEIAIMLDGTVKTRDVINNGKWIIDPTYTWTQDLTLDKFIIVINSVTITLVKDPFTDGYKTDDKTIVIGTPVLTHDKPTKNDDIDPNTGCKWAIDCATGLPYPDLEDKWPKDPITGGFVNPVTTDVPELDDVKHPETGLPLDIDADTGIVIPKVPTSDKE